MHLSLISAVTPGMATAARHTCAFTFRTALHHLRGPYPPEARHQQSVFFNQSKKLRLIPRVGNSHGFLGTPSTTITGALRKWSSGRGGSAIVESRWFLC